MSKIDQDHKSRIKSILEKRLQYQEINTTRWQLTYEDKSLSAELRELAWKNYCQASQDVEFTKNKLASLEKGDFDRFREVARSELVSMKARVR